MTVNKKVMWLTFLADPFFLQTFFPLTLNFSVYCPSVCPRQNFSTVKNLIFSGDSVQAPLIFSFFSASLVSWTVGAEYKGVKQLCIYSYFRVALPPPGHADIRSNAHAVTLTTEIMSWDTINEANANTTQLLYYCIKSPSVIFSSFETFMTARPRVKHKVQGRMMGIEFAVRIFNWYLPDGGAGC